MIALKRKSFIKAIELRNELKIIFTKQPVSASVNKLIELLHDEEWLMKLACLTDIFVKLNVSLIYKAL